MAITLPLILATAVCQSALAFSPIWNVDGWDAAQLNKAGISVKPWTQRPQWENPPLEWIEVTFDCSQLPKSQDVMLTAKLISVTSTAGAAANESTSSDVRVQRDPQGDDRLSLVFAIQGEHLPHSHVTVVIWEEKPNGRTEAHGYRLSVKRAVELARAEELARN